MNPLVSICIPAYNAEKFLAQTLRSVLAQTWPRTEVIVIDDGSRDGTLALARKFESPTVKVVAQENRGQSATENRAFNESQGDFVEFLDADDLMAPDKIEVQVRRLLAEGDDCVATCRWGRFRETPEDAYFKPEPFWTDLAPVDWLVACWERHSMMHGATWLIPRGVIGRSGLWDETLSLINDFDFFPRVLLACRKVCFCPEAVTYYRSALPTSLSASTSAKALDSAIRALEASTARLLAVEDSPRTRRACVRQFQEFIYAYYPSCPDLLERAERHVARLGGPQFPPQGGVAFRWASRILGWRTARRVQQRMLRWGWRRPRKAMA
jgi:glycosyltransferase involved in cell wall biosynthesis